MIRVVIADDHKLVCQGIASMLAERADIEIAGICWDGETALACIKKERPDVAVLDISMPGLTGLEVAQALAQEGVRVNIIFLTLHKDITKLRLALNLGANGYVLKDSIFADLTGAIDRAAAGKVFIDEQMREKLETYEADSLLSPDITAREREVLKLIASGLSNREAADALCISIKTVETHRMNLMRKLGVHRVADLVKYAMENGVL